MNASATDEQIVTALIARQRRVRYQAFMLGRELYAFPHAQTREIVGYEMLTWVPDMPSFIRGIVQRRDRIVPVVDLSVRFGIRRSGITPRTCIAIVEVANSIERQDVGVVIDPVSWILDIPPADIETPSPNGAVRPEFVRGIGKIDGMTVTILNLENVVSVDELALVSTQIRHIVCEDRAKGRRGKT